MKKNIQLFIVTLLLCLFVSSVIAQISNKFEKYSSELNLTEKQKEGLISIITECDEKLVLVDADDIASYNRILKEEISKIYHLLTKDQFLKFKELRPTIEDNKEFRSN